MPEETMEEFLPNQSNADLRTHIDDLTKAYVKRGNGQTWMGFDTLERVRIYAQELLRRGEEL